MGADLFHYAAVIIGVTFFGFIVLIITPRDSFVWLRIYKYLLAPSIDTTQLKVGDPDASFDLYKRLKGRCGKKTSKFWLQRSANGGSILAIYELALVTHNLEIALALFYRAAENNIRDSLYRCAKIINSTKSAEYSWDDIFDLFSNNE